MGRTARRKQNKRATLLNRLASGKPSRFRQEWELRIRSWLEEINRCAKAHQRGEESAEKIFAVVARAAETLSRLTPETRRLVGAETLNELRDACAVAVARVYQQPHLHRLISGRYQLGRDWQRHLAAMDANLAPPRS